MGKQGHSFSVQHPDRTVWLGNLPQGISHTDIMPVMKTVGDCKRVQVGKGTGFAFFSTPAEAQAAISQLNGATIGGASIQVDTWTVLPKTGPRPEKAAKSQPAANQQKGSVGVWKQQFQKQTGQNSWSSPGGSFQKTFQQFMTMMQSMQGGNMQAMQSGNAGQQSAKKAGAQTTGKKEFKVQHPERTVWVGNLTKGTKAEDLLPLFKTVGDCKKVEVGKKGSGFAFFGNQEGALAAIASLNGAVVNGREIQVDEWTKPEKKAK